jgi:CubicO group peptidase (beta-lactamase class C family)
MTATRRIVAVACALGALAACTSSPSSSPSTSASGGAGRSGTSVKATTASADPDKAAAITKIVEDRMRQGRLRSAIVRVTVDGEEVVTEAFGESMTGVPATTDMHFRNGAVAISYVSTLLLMLVDEKKVTLDDKVSTWLPDLPNADQVTLGQLAQMTSGYADYVIGNDAFVATFLADPFQPFTPEQLLAFAVDKPLWYPPGTNWNYAHTNYVILGLVLEKLTGRPVSELLRDKVLGPLGLDDTTDPGTPAIPEPALHAFTSERREALGIPDGTRFYEESTFWNPSWTITRGAVQTTTIHDLSDTAIAMGTGQLLSKDSYQKMISTGLRGAGAAVPGCVTCRPQTELYSYGLGIVTTGSWVMQNPLFAGEAGAFAYLPAQEVGIAVAVTFTEAAFTSDGSYVVQNEADDLWREIGTYLAPADPPPTRPS